MTNSLNIQRKAALSAGGLSLPWVFDTTITAGPAAGKVRLNNATPGSVTELYVNETAKYSIAGANFLALAVKGSRVTLSAANKPESVLVMQVTSNTDNGADRTLVVTVIYAAGTFAAGDLCNLQIDNVALPAKPADSGTFKLQCIDSVLTWTADA